MCEGPRTRGRTRAGSRVGASLARKDRRACHRAEQPTHQPSFVSQCPGSPTLCPQCRCRWLTWGFALVSTAGQVPVQDALDGQQRRGPHPGPRGRRLAQVQGRHWPFVCGPACSYANPPFAWALWARVASQSSVGTVTYVPEKSAIVWSIKQFPGGKEFLMRAHFGLPTVRKGAGPSRVAYWAAPMVPAWVRLTCAPPRLARDCRRAGQAPADLGQVRDPVLHHVGHQHQVPQGQRKVGLPGPAVGPLHHPERRYVCVGVCAGGAGRRKGWGTGGRVAGRREGGGTGGAQVETRVGLMIALAWVRVLTADYEFRMSDPVLVNKAPEPR